MALDKVRDAEGVPLWAHFDVEDDPTDSDLFAVYLESRGGARGGVNERNPDYERALRLILRRLAASGADLVDATVESTVTRTLDHAAKVINPGTTFPVDLGSVDAEALRLALQRSQRTIGQLPTATGSGNNTKRIRLLVRVPGQIMAAVREMLAFGVSDDVVAAEDAAAVLGGRRGGQGYATDSVALKAVEDHAMLVVRAKLEADLWVEITDVSASESYDFRCRRPGEELRVEVKGTRGSEEVVIVTSNEVVHARSGVRVAIGIVTDIDLNRIGGVPQPRGGKLHWHEPWDIDAGALEPTQYRWRPKA
jgi:hypothetical protein